MPPPKSLTLPPIVDPPFSKPPASSQNQTALVNRLPNEVLHIIFVLTQPELATDSSLPESLAKPATVLLGVCRRWYDVAVALPELWCRFVVKGSVFSTVCNMEQYAERLRRSKDRPLTLLFPFNFSWLLDNDSSKLFFEDHIHRWEDVRYWIIKSKSALELAAVLSRAPKMLKRLDVDGINADLLGVFSLLGSLPNLAHLKLKSRVHASFEYWGRKIPRGNGISLSNLKEFHFDNKHFPVTCLALLKYCPQLEIAQFWQQRRDTSAARHQRYHPVVLPKLWSLTFAQHSGGRGLYGGKVLAGLVLPTLRNLVIGPASISIRNPNEGSDIYEMSLERTGPEVDFIRLIKNEFRQILRLDLFKGVASLVMKGCPAAIGDLTWNPLDPIFPSLSNLTLRDCGSMSLLISNLIVSRSGREPIPVTLRKAVIIFPKDSEEGLIINAATEAELTELLRKEGYEVSWETVRDIGSTDECAVVNVDKTGAGAA
ncbi:hypothetical protein DXG01_011542 [Tephrocybe rancida]|nr:hypothetical protein DXG01_011542 [Tephrocybe rancida]